MCGGFPAAQQAALLADRGLKKAPRSRGCSLLAQLPSPPWFSFLTLLSTPSSKLRREFESILSLLFSLVYSLNWGPELNETIFSV